MAFEVPQLKYSFDALEKAIDAKTMEIHHDKHHAAYVKKLNEALEGTEWENSTIENVLRNLDSLTENIRTAVRNNGGGHANHSLFWNIMSPSGGGEPSGDLETAINSAFGSFDAFKEKLSSVAATQFGSGWGWLAVSGEGNLEVYSTPNQDSPYMQGDTPILGIDVWEHAYYLRYQNLRPDYIVSWWNVVDWTEVEANYHKALNTA